MTRRPGPFAAASIAALACIGLAGPCAAQMSPGMPSKGQTDGGMAAKPMTEAEMAKMKACNAMSPAAMAKDRDCMKMMRVHPDMMQHPGAMKSGG